MNDSSKIPLISVVIPVFNMANRLSFMIKALQKQDYNNLEVIVYDDASEDNVCEALAKLNWEKSFTATSLIRGEINGGESFARNRGFEASHGDYIVFLDADDLIESNFISTLYTAINKNNYDYAACGHKTLELSTGKLVLYPLKISQTATPSDILVGRILNKYVLCQCAILYTKRFLLETGLKYAENCTGGADLEFLLKMFCYEPRGTFVEDCLYTYVFHPEMGSRLYTQDRQKKFRRYRDHAYAQVRQACYVIHHSKGKPQRIAYDMLFPNACQCLLSVFAMCGDRARYDELQASARLRQNLWAAWRSFLYKPEIFIRSIIALFFPNLYWSKYSHYL